MAVGLVLTPAAIGCGDDDSSNGSAAAPAQQQIDPKELSKAQEAYQDAFEQCERYGPEPLRAQYGRNQSLAVLAQLFITGQSGFYDEYVQEAIRGCEAGLSR
jgi:hypothetical protein